MFYSLVSSKFIPLRRDFRFQVFFLDLQEKNGGLGFVGEEKRSMMFALVLVGVLNLCSRLEAANRFGFITVGPVFTPPDMDMTLPPEIQPKISIRGKILKSFLFIWIQVPNRIIDT